MEPCYSQGDHCHRGLPALGAAWGADLLLVWHQQAQWWWHNWVQGLILKQAASVSTAGCQDQCFACDQSGLRWDRWNPFPKSIYWRFSMTLTGCSQSPFPEIIMREATICSIWGTHPLLPLPKGNLNKKLFFQYPTGLHLPWLHPLSLGNETLHTAPAPSST